MSKRDPRRDPSKGDVVKSGRKGGSLVTAEVIESFRGFVRAAWDGTPYTVTLEEWRKWALRGQIVWKGGT